MGRGLEKKLTLEINNITNNFGEKSSTPISHFPIAIEESKVKNSLKCPVLKKSCSIQCPLLLWLV